MQYLIVAASAVARRSGPPAEPVVQQRCLLCTQLPHGLHALQVLGLDPLGFGSVLSLLVNFVLTDTPLTKLRRVWEHLLSSYKALKVVERFKA